MVLVVWVAASCKIWASLAFTKGWRGTPSPVHASSKSPKHIFSDLRILALSYLVVVPTNCKRSIVVGGAGAL